MLELIGQTLVFELLLALFSEIKSYLWHLLDSIFITFALIFRLQTGMRGAFGKPQGTVARVHIGQVIMSVRTKAQNKEHVIEALRRAKFKFPGRQKVNVIHLGKETLGCVHRIFL